LLVFDYGFSGREVGHGGDGEATHYQAAGRVIWTPWKEIRRLKDENEALTAKFETLTGDHTRALGCLEQFHAENQRLHTQLELSARVKEIQSKNKGGK
jgi:hypothetical protein